MSDATKFLYFRTYFFINLSQLSKKYLHLMRLIHVAMVLKFLNIIWCHRYTVHVQKSSGFRYGRSCLLLENQTLESPPSWHRWWTSNTFAFFRRSSGIRRQTVNRKLCERPPSAYKCNDRGGGRAEHLSPLILTHDDDDDDDKSPRSPDCVI